MATKSEATPILKFFREQSPETARMILDLVLDELEERMEEEVPQRGRPKGSKNKPKETETMTADSTGGAPV